MTHFSFSCGVSLLDYRLVRGLDFKSLPPNQVEVSPGVCIDDTNTRPIKISSTLTLGLTTDLDTGSPVASTWYYLWLTRGEDSEGSGILSTSSTSPTLPPGSYKRRIGALRYQANSSFLSLVSWGGSLRFVRYLENMATTLAALVGGNSPSYSNISTRTFVPPTAKNVRAAFKHRSPAQEFAYFRPNGVSPALIYASETDALIDDIPKGTNEEIQYYVTVGRADLFILGYSEEL